MTTFFDQSKESLVDLKKLMKWVSEIKLTEIGGESCEDDKEETPDQESATPGNSVNKVNSKYWYVCHQLIDIELFEFFVLLVWLKKVYYVDGNSNQK